MATLGTIPTFGALVACGDDGQLVRLPPEEEKPLGSLECQPGFLDFGNVERGATASRTVTCTAPDAGARLGEIAVTGLYFSVPTPPEPRELRAKGQVTFEVVYAPDGVLMEHQGELSVDTGSAPVKIGLKGVEIAPPPTTQAIALQLRWSTDLTDIDLHLVRDGGQPFNVEDDMHYRNRESPPSWGPTSEYTPQLDADNTSGYGPENINLARAAPGTYSVMVHYYDSLAFDSTSATVEVFIDGERVGAYSQTIRCDDLWTVGRIVWSGSSGTFQPSTQVTPGAIQQQCR